jgi:transposase
MTTPASEVYIGIDVCKAWLDVWLHPQGKTLRFINDAGGIGELLKTLSGWKVARIALEATGGWELACAGALQAAGHVTVVANPRWVQAFGMSIGKLAKTDALDARLLALYAAHAPSTERAVITPAQDAMKALAARRRQLVMQITGERNRLHATRHTAIRQDITKHLSFLQAALKRCEAHILAVFKADAVLMARWNILLSIPGIGIATAMTLLIDMPELGTLGAPQAAALAGLAPLDRQSGKTQGRAVPHAGRTTVRTALYMAAMSAKRYNSHIKPFYDRLIANGKRPIVALVASMRKLLILANALLAQQRTFSSQWNYAT